MGQHGDVPRTTRRLYLRRILSLTTKPRVCHGVTIPRSHCCYASDSSLSPTTMASEFWMQLLDKRSTVNLDGLGRLEIFVVSAFALLLSFTCQFLRSKTRTGYFSDPRVLQALSAFVTPTSCASISKNHTSFLKKTKIFKSYLIELDLSDLIDSICMGMVELRDSSDLDDLFRERLRIYGWHFGLLVGRNWSFRISRWMIAHHVHVFLRVSLYSPRKHAYSKF